MFKAYLTDIPLSIANIRANISLYKAFLDDERPETKGLHPVTRKPTRQLVFDVEAAEKFMADKENAEVLKDLARTFLPNPRDALRGYLTPDGEWVVLPSSKALKQQVKQTENIPEGLHAIAIVPNDLEERLLGEKKYIIKAAKNKKKVHDPVVEHQLEVLAKAMLKSGTVVYGHGFIGDNLHQFVIRPYVPSIKDGLAEGTVFMEIVVLKSLNTLKPLEEIASPQTASEAEVLAWAQALQRESAPMPYNELVSKEAEMYMHYIENPLTEEELLKLKEPEVAVPEFMPTDTLDLAASFSMKKKEPVLVAVTQ